MAGNADRPSNVVLNFKMDGQVQYAKTLKDINAVMNAAAKEYKNHVAAMGDDAKATDKLVVEKKKLEIQMDAAKKRTEMLRKEYETMSKSTKTTTGQLTQMYSKLLDSERAEISLQKSLDRVNGGLSDQAIEAGKAKEVLANLQGESRLLEAEQKKLVSSFKLQNAELGNSASEADKLELAQKQIREQMALTEKAVSNLENQLEQSKKVYGENSVEVTQLESKLNGAKSTIAEFSNKLDGIKTSGDKAGDGLESIGKKLDLNNLMEASEALQGVTDSLISLGKSAMDSALQFGDSQTNLQANLGLTAEEAEKLNGVVKDVFNNGVVESVEEANQAVVTVKSAFDDLNNADLEKLTNQITTIAKRTGTDVVENTNAAQQMVTAFGISGSQAMDLIAAGYQNNLNKSGDFLDTLNEYSPHFAAAGYSAKDMLEIINNGMQNGALNTDKAADAVKEFQIRLGDGSFEKIVGNYSTETQNMFDKWKSGQATVADVAGSISKDLNKMTPIEQQKALSEISTQFEDLGVNGAAALFSVGHAFDDVNGKADQMSQKTPGEKWTSALHELQTTLQPIGQNLLDALSPVLTVLSALAKLFGMLPGPVQTFITVFGGLITLVGVAIPIIAGLIASVGVIAPLFTAVGVSAGGASIGVGALMTTLLPIIGIVAAVAAAIAGIVLVIKNWGGITDWVSDKWGKFTSWLSKTTSNLSKNFVKGFDDMKKGAVNKFGELKSGAEKTISNFKTNAVNKANEIKTGFVNKVNDLRIGAVKKLNDMKNSAGNVMNKAKDMIVSPIELARDKISGIISKIKGFFTNLKLKIPTPSLPKLPHFSLEWDSKEILGKTIKYPSGFDVKWYAQGGIFTQPTIFSTPYGAKGVGEAGPEAVLPLNDKTLGAIGEAIAKTMSVGGGGGVIVQQMIVRDDQDIQKISRELNNLMTNFRRARGNR